MKIEHYMKREKSGLAFSTLELVKAEQDQGHQVCVREPSDRALIYGSPLEADVECIHSQLPIASYGNGKARFLWCHGEPLSSVGNGVSMKAIVDMAPLCDAFIAMRQEEWAVWNTIKRTYIVPKGIDLDRFKPLTDVTEKLSGEPAVLYVENWRGQRNPLYLIVAMQKVWQKWPNARLHLYNCGDKRMFETFQALIKHCKLWTYVRTLNGPVDADEMNKLYNRADIVVSCLFPLYARSLEAFGAGKAFIGPGYTNHGYPFHCTLDPESIADTIVKCWENYDSVNYRKHAEIHHDVQETVRQATKIYERYL